LDKLKLQLISKHWNKKVKEIFKEKIKELRKEKNNSFINLVILDFLRQNIL